jgi:hypothetical protein
MLVTYLSVFIGSLGRTLGLVRRVTQSENEGSLVILSHLCQDLRSESPGAGRSTNEDSGFDFIDQIQ